MEFRGWRDQQVAYQPSGNGTSPQTSPLSLAAFGNRLNFGAYGKKSSCGEGATAVLTASSNRSNSASLIALSHVRERTVSKLFWFQIETIVQVLSTGRRRLKWLRLY